MIISTHNQPLNDPRAWLKAPMFAPPEPASEIAAVQREVDSILGVSRDGKPKAMVIWNGDKRYWKGFHTDWNAFGKPKGEIRRRPFVLYKTITNAKGEFVRDAFVPRFLLCTRSEPEQYVPTWARDSKVFDPARQCYIQIQPAEPPALYLRWFQTIADHNGLCCKTAAKNDAACFGFYAHPRAVLEDLRILVKGMAETNIKQSSPFETADEVGRRMAENQINNYEEQTVRQFRAQKLRLIEEAPLALAPADLLERRADLGTIRRAVAEQAKRDIERMENQIRGK